MNIFLNDRLAAAGLVFCLAIVGFFTGAAKAQQPAKGELKTVPQVDIKRYMGKWYEIASIPASFQKFCVGGTTATYTLLSDGTVQVLNQCYDNSGGLKKATGRAWIPDPKQNSKILVSFLPFVRLGFLAGDYWIIDLGANYEYAVVGHPTRGYGWILSRTPTLPEDTLNRIKERLAAQGYDFSRFKMTDQAKHVK